MVGTSGALRILYETERPQPRPGLFLYRARRAARRRGRRALGRRQPPRLARARRSPTPRARCSSAAPTSTASRSCRSSAASARPAGTPTRPGAIAGLTFETTPRDIRQAALEGVALPLRGDRRPAARGRGGRRDRRRRSCADPDWIQLMADALARPVTASGVEEASLRGAAVATLERLGHEAAEAPLGEVFHPREERAEAYRSARERQAAALRGAPWRILTSNSSRSTPSARSRWTPCSRRTPAIRARRWRSRRSRTSSTRR